MIRTVLACGVAAAVFFQAGCTPTPEPRVAVGILIEVNGPGPLPQSFSVRTDDGQVLTFRPAPDFDRASQHAMTAGHMRQHMALVERVGIRYQVQGDTLVALSASDQ